MILDKNLQQKYFGRFGDQKFLEHQIWPRIQQHDSVAHDSFHCQTSVGKNRSQPWPTQRLESNNQQINLFVGCYRPCSSHDKRLMIHQCPLECRPKEHQDWIKC
ncbi:unnamed protein product [Didymodactylos carnosus]|nr:unnamed protein product [Didymodactylos carnosus]CAF4654577.1 unnamed protein product [Didymodactylos carnosus]